jgi:hypothetical protein
MSRAVKSYAVAMILTSIAFAARNQLHRRARHGKRQRAPAPNRTGRLHFD